MSTAKKVDPNKARTDLAIDTIKAAMKRKDLKLSDFCRAVNAMVEEITLKTILRLHADGKNIRAIARTVHMDDRRVSAVIKANVAPTKKAAPCKKGAAKKAKGKKAK